MSCSRRARACVVAVCSIIVGGCSESPTVGTPAIGEIRVDPETAHAWVGGTLTLTAAALRQDGTVAPGASIVWASGDTTVAKVDGAGRVTMKRPGTVTISASAGGRTGHATVRVFGLDLLYEGAPHGTPEILRVGPEASVPQRILPPGTVAGEPVPSPDGSRIAFVVADYSQATGDIYVVNLDGTGLRRLTDDSELDDSPAWSPDGSRIVFRSYRSGLDGELWIMDAADGGGLRNLTPQRGSAVIDHRRPAWSPDGDRIAFASTAGGTWDIWTMRADGSDWRRLTSSPALDAEPAWSPDGARLVFRGCDAAAGCDLFLVDAAGGTALRVAFAGDERMPAWSPDGQRIAFVHQEPSAPTPRLFTIRPDGTDRRPVPIDASWGAALKPAWLRY